MKLEEALSTRGPSAPAGDDLAARAEDIGREPLGLSDLAFAQAVEGHEQDVLDQVVRGGGVAQVAESVEAHPRSEPSEELRLCLAVSAGQASRQLALTSAPDTVALDQGLVRISHPLTVDV